MTDDHPGRWPMGGAAILALEPTCFHLLAPLRDYILELERDVKNRNAALAQRDDDFDRLTLERDALRERIRELELNGCPPSAPDYYGRDETK